MEESLCDLLHDSPSEKESTKASFLVDVVLATTKPSLVVLNSMVYCNIS
jgi:hypothetical protein